MASFLEELADAGLRTTLGQIHWGETWTEVVLVENENTTSSDTTVEERHR